MDRIKADIAVIGAGSAGLVAASGAAQLGRKVVLFEKGEMGGDCLNFGCVPSKSLIAAAHMAHAPQRSSAFGVELGDAKVDWSRVRAHVHDVIAAIAPIDSQERFEGLGVRVIREAARFLDRQTVASASIEVRARRIIIATGGRAAIPPIPGLAEAPFLTNETIFSIDALPTHLVILGAGPIGLELGQSFRRLGARVTIIEPGRLFRGEEEEAALILRERFAAEKIELLEGLRALSVETSGPNALAISVESPTGPRRLEASHLLLAAGRTPNVEGLNLEAAGVAYNQRGVITDAHLRTTNKKIYALGDIAGREAFTHVAGLHGGLFVRNALFRLSQGRADGAPIPRVIYTDPNIGFVGMNEAQARKTFGDAVRVLETPIHDNDRAQTERDIEGFARIIVRKNGEILGGAVVGAGAGDLIGALTLAMANKLKIGAFTSSFVAPYPTRIEALKRAAGQFYTPTLFAPRTRLLVDVLARF